MSQTKRFALNRIMQPSLSLPEFIRLAADCSASGIEIRNDLADPSLLGGESPEGVCAMCADSGVEIVTVNALQRFNDPLLFRDKEQELSDLMNEALSVGCRQIVLCPVNDPEDTRSETGQHDDLVLALTTYGPMLEEAGMTGLVEPLGFGICSLRFKEQAVRAINESGRPDRFRLVHDTFHHYLSGEERSFPHETGLIHASGVVTGKAMQEFSDDDRLMVDDRDVMGNREQVDVLYTGGYDGYISFEPFSPAVQAMSPNELVNAVQGSLAYLFD